MIRVILAAQDYKRNTGRDVFIISGWRSAEEQAALKRAGRPTAPDELSNHRSCLSTAVDVDLGFLVPNGNQLAWGVAAVHRGLRWGGGSPVDPKTSIPSDWAHVDVGPRSSARNI